MAYQPLLERTIRRGLATDVVGRQIVCLKTVGSTNDWLKAAAAEGAPEGLAVFAEEQTAGRGRLGRSWVVPPGCGILVSILLRPSLSPNQLACLTMLGACAASAGATDVTGIPVPLKWPNDLVTERGKLGGILTEASVVDGQVEHVILGIGLNVNLSRHQLTSIPGATSLQAETGRPVNRNALARALLRSLDQRYALIQAGRLDAIADDWRQRLSTIGKWVSLRTSVGVEEPLYAEGVTEKGALILRQSDGTTFEVVVGEVSVRLTSGPEYG
jgi:BirA family biotin operon repressor/biotin-[acetyl-CoA-carboxylase] ligase